MTIVTRYDRDMNPKVRALNKAKGRIIPDITRSHEKTVMKHIAKKGFYEMPEKRKKEISDSWERQEKGTGFYEKIRIKNCTY